MKEEYKLNPEGNFYVTEIPSGSGTLFAFKKWTWGEKNALTSDCIVINPLNGFTTMDNIKFNEQLVLRTAFKKVEGNIIPFTLEEIKNMDGQLGERLFRITQAINLISDVETQNL